MSETFKSWASVCNRLMAVPNLNWVCERKGTMCSLVFLSNILLMLVACVSYWRILMKISIFINFKFKLKNILYVHFKNAHILGFSYKIYLLQIFFLIKKIYIYNRGECTECFCETVQCVYNSLKIQCRTQGSGSVFTYAAFPIFLISFGSGFPRLICSRLLDLSNPQAFSVPPGIRSAPGFGSKFSFVYSRNLSVQKVKAKQSCKGKMTRLKKNKVIFDKCLFFTFFSQKI